MQCKLSVPRRSDDDCAFATSKNPPPSNIGGSIRLVDAGASVKRLDPGMRNELRELLETGITYPTLTIEPGMHYLDQGGQVAVARARLTTTMAMGAVAPPSSMAVFDDDGQQCGEICNLDDDQDYLNWKLSVWTAPRWTYISASGGAFTAHGAPGMGQDIASVLWQHGQWTLNTQHGLGAPCDLRVFIELFTQRTIDAGLDSFTQYGDNSPVVANPANGCVVELHAEENPGAHLRPDVLYRLGVVLAANADARRIFPGLPVASAAEQAIAQAIHTEGGTIIARTGYI
jgi:hypothetical protein